MTKHHRGFMLSRLQDPTYVAALRSGTGPQKIADTYGISRHAVRRDRKKLGINTTPEADNTTPAGESETHNADGSNYVRFSDRPWGYNDFRDFIRTNGLDPDKVTFTHGWTSKPGGGFWNKLNNVRPIADPEQGEVVDLPAPNATASLGRGSATKRSHH